MEREGTMALGLSWRCGLPPAQQLMWQSSQQAFMVTFLWSTCS